MTAPASPPRPPVTAALLLAAGTLLTGVVLAGLLPAGGSAAASSGTSSPDVVTAVTPARPAPATAPARAPGRSALRPPLPVRAAAAIPPATQPAVRPGLPAAGLDCERTADGLQLCVHGEDAPATSGHDDHGQGGEPGGLVAVAGGDAPLACLDDGQSGPRVRAVYARPAGSADQYAHYLPSFRHWASVVERQFDTSAARTGGRRHVRFATTAGPDCVLSVVRVTLPTSAFASFRATVDALQSLGYGRDGAKNLVWADASGYCGIGSTYVDDSPGPTNANNASAGFARVDRRCWGTVEAHEIVHMLGGVQPSAPHSTAGLHCNDGEDVMCYDDGTARSAQHAVCSGSAQLLDCRNDDYYSTAAPRGSYLQTHWNVARSAYLSASTSEPQPAPAPASASPAPAPSRAPSPSPSSSSSPSATPAPHVGGLQLPLLPPLPILLAGAR